MAASDNLYKAKANTAFGFPFPIYKSDGTLITALWAGVVITCSVDYGAVVTNIGTVTQVTNLGMGFLDFTSGQIGTNKIIIGTVSCTNVGSVPTPFTVNIVGDAEDRVNVVDWSGSAVASPATAGYPVVTNKVGTGTGELDLSSGVIKANLVQILATALTETSGQIAGAFKQFFNISSPTGTVNLIPIVTNLTNAPTSGDFTSVMKTSLNAATPAVTVSDKTGFSLSAAGVLAIWDRATSGITTSGSIGKAILDFFSGLTYSAPPDSTAIAAATQTGLSNQGYTVARAGYLANLNVGGNVASQADITALNQSASRRVLLTTIGQAERPESGIVTFTIIGRTYTDDGAAVNADSTPTLTATGLVSGSLASHLSAAVNSETGKYVWTYTVNSTDTIEQVTFDLSAVISSSTFTLSALSQIVDVVSSPWTSADRTQLQAVFNKLPSTTYLAGSTSSDGNVAADVVAGLNTNGYNSTRAGYMDVLNGLVAAVQSGLATSAGLTALQSHGDSTWPTANISTLLTTAHFDTAVSDLIDTSALNDAVDAIKAYGDIHWPTANVSGVTTQASFNSFIAQFHFTGNELDSNLTKVAGASDAADNLKVSAQNILRGNVIGSPTTTHIPTDLTETNDNQYRGRIILFTSGLLDDQVSEITAYDGSTKILTVITLTDAPTAGDDFLII